jgi:hypothetical protein
MKGCWRLGDLLAAAASELLADGLHHLPLARHHLQRLVSSGQEAQSPTAAEIGGARLNFIAGMLVSDMHHFYILYPATVK